MTWLIEMLLANAVVATALAALAWLARRFVRRPALQHALWVLVLVKLVTPPLVPVRIPVPASWGGYLGVHKPPHLSTPTISPSPIRSTASSIPSVQSDRPSQSDAGHAVTLATERHEVASGSGSRTDAPPSANPVVPAAPTGLQTLTAPVVEERSVEPHLTWPVGSLVTAILLGAWGIGSLVWWGLNARLVARFGRQLRVVGLRDRQLERRAGELAARLGLVRVPQIHIIDMGVAPMLWGCAKWTKIVLPARLLERLDDESRDALLLHELAHFRRGDQWVRVLELIATGLYWWHPVVWWAKRQIAVHEEECCDALAVSHSPTPRRYADVLLETLDFIADYRPGLVPVSSAISDVPVIERRLHMIMTGGIPWSLSNWGRCGLICLLAVLPYQPLLMAAVPVAAPNEVQRSANVLVPSAVRSIADPGGLVDQTYASPPIAQSPAGFVGSIREIRLPPTTEHPLLETGPSQDVWSAAASMNGRYQLRALSGGRVHLSDGSSGRTTDLTREGITAAVFLNREHLLAGTKAGDVRIYDAASGAAVSFLGQHREEVTSVALMSNSRRAVTASRDGGIFVWDLETNGAILYQGNIQRPISMLRPSPDGRVLAVACGDWLSKAGTAVLLDFASGELREFQAGAPIGALAFQANGDLLLTADWEGRVTFWDVATGDQLGHGRVAKDAVSAAGFSPDMDALSKLVMTDTVGTGAADMAPPASLPQR